MIKVIRRGHRKEAVRFTCKNCYSVLEAKLEDVKYEEHYPDSRDYIVCPVCGRDINVNLNDWAWEKPAEEIRTDPYDPSWF